MKKALYPGSFNPFHEGHLNILDKALKLFDEVIVIVSINPDKNNFSNLEERFKLVCKKLKQYKNVKVIKNSNNLIANIAKELDANFLIRSARTTTDYEYELDLAAGNHSLNNDLETILILPDYDKIDYSSTLLRHKKILGK